jgi:hypothetical protein
MSPTFPSACRQFLQDLHEHARSSAEGLGAPHVSDCPSCAARLQAARHQDQLLRAAEIPAPPAALRTAAFLAAIHERIVEDYASSDLGRGLQQAMQPVQAPEVLPWPGQDLVGKLPEVAGVAASSPIDLWPTVRQHVMREIHDRRLLRRRRYVFASAAAGLLLVGGALQFLPGGGGPPEDPHPIFVRVDTMPASADFISPTLALQRANQK